MSVVAFLGPVLRATLSIVSSTEKPVPPQWYAPIDPSTKVLNFSNFIPPHQTRRSTHPPRESPEPLDVSRTFEHLNEDLLLPEFRRRGMIPYPCSLAPASDTHVREREKGPFSRRAETTTTSRFSRSLWTLDKIKEHIMEVIRMEGGEEGVMPTRQQLLRAGRRSLAYVINNRGGFTVVAQDLGLRPSTDALRSPPRRVEKRMSIEELRNALFDFINAQEGADISKPPVMPTTTALRRSGREDLIESIRLHGGRKCVAKALDIAPTRISLEAQLHREWRKRWTQHHELEEGPQQAKVRLRRPMHYWNSWANFERELRAFVDKHGVPGIMPYRKELLTNGASSLVRAIVMWGGQRKVARRLGLRMMRPEVKRRVLEGDPCAMGSLVVDCGVGKYGTPPLGLIIYPDGSPAEKQFMENRRQSEANPTTRPRRRANRPRKKEPLRYQLISLSPQFRYGTSSSPSKSVSDNVRSPTRNEYWPPVPERPYSPFVPEDERRRRRPFRSFADVASSYGHPAASASHSHHHHKHRHHSGYGGYLHPGMPQEEEEEEEEEGHYDDEMSHTVQDWYDEMADPDHGLIGYQRGC